MKDGYIFKRRGQTGKWGQSYQERTNGWTNGWGQNSVECISKTVSSVVNALMLCQSLLNFYDLSQWGKMNDIIVNFTRMQLDHKRSIYDDLAIQD